MGIKKPINSPSKKAINLVKSPAKSPPKASPIVKGVKGYTGTKEKGKKLNPPMSASMKRQKDAEAESELDLWANDE